MVIVFLLVLVEWKIMAKKTLLGYAAMQAW